MTPIQARIIARLAHKGQKYGSADYFEFHVENVVRRCEQNKHCTYGDVTLALLHDVVEDTDLAICDLRALGLDEFMATSLMAITKHGGSEDYASYLTRVLEDPAATFVKYHDLRENIHQCSSVIDGYADNITKARFISLRKRYIPALDRIIETRPYFLYEGCS